MIAKMKQTTAANILRPRLLDQNLKLNFYYLSHNTSNNTPSAIKRIAAPTWARIGASLGAHQVIVIQRRPKPTATRALHPRVFLKLS